MHQNSAFLSIPPKDGVSKDWISQGQAIIFGLSGKDPHPASLIWLQVGETYQKSSLPSAHKAVLDYFETTEIKVYFEWIYMHWQPLYAAIIGYVFLFLGVMVFWLFGKPIPAWLYSIGFGVFALHTSGILIRMGLQGRPPVTNLYSSAVFVGWISGLLGFGLEHFRRNGVGLLGAAVTGFLTLIIAHHLAIQGDTLEMMQAVLDSNFWLSTHVVTVTMGYGAMFLAGFLAHVYIFNALFSKRFTPELAKQLVGMVYGTICFGLLFSFIGTVLGGIWADQSWGRFWGWDPKENGAFMIVLFGAAILHARLAGMIKDRGLMAMAVFGNILTAFSWFGVNMLGVGLHSYGFMAKAFFWLSLFVFVEIMVIWLGYLPKGYYRSFLKRED